jgi:hypothetical protein
MAGTVGLAGKFDQSLRASLTPDSRRLVPKPLVRVSAGGFRFQHNYPKIQLRPPKRAAFSLWLAGSKLSRNSLRLANRTNRKPRHDVKFEADRADTQAIDA